MKQHHPIYAFAPMEGITTFVFRSVHHRHFPGVDRYYTPFLSATQTLHFKKKELRDILPENNKDLCLVPQVLGNKASEVAWAIRAVGEMGYPEVNFNLGCPMATVARRGKGAGFLAPPERLDRFFDALFSLLDQAGAGSPLVSVKTRMGLSDPREAETLMEIYNRYPISMLTIHPRLQTDLYHGHPDLEIFGAMLERSRHPVLYNGDVTTASDSRRILERFPQVEGVMTGRGYLRDPALICRQRGTEGASISRIRAFLSDLWDGYEAYLKEDTQVVAKMKEIWLYLKYWALPEREVGQDGFFSHVTDTRYDPLKRSTYEKEAVVRPLKKLFKAHTRAQYDEALQSLFDVMA